MGYGRRRQQEQGNSSSIPMALSSSSLSESDMDDMVDDMIANANFTVDQRRQLQSGGIACALVRGFCDFGDIGDAIHVGELLVGTFTGGIATIALDIASTFWCEEDRFAVRCQGAH
jgi:hypothetical protein